MNRSETKSNLIAIPCKAACKTMPCYAFRNPSETLIERNQTLPKKYDGICSTRAGLTNIAIANYK